MTPTEKIAKQLRDKGSPAARVMEERVEPLFPHGFYSTLRKCSSCGFTTFSRDAFWKHVEESHRGEDA